MGLPEVADFARNFAVMVRVQGPDPKGLKMRNHAFHHYSSGRTTLSASGMLFMGSNRDEGSSGTVVVLTVASVIEPFLSQQYRDNGLQDKAHLIQGTQIDILAEGKCDAEDNDDRPVMESLPWLPAELLGIVDIPQSSAAIQSLIEASSVLMENGWEVGWSLASHSRGPQHIIGNSHAQVEHSSFQSQWLVPRTDSSYPSLMGQSATRIALLAIRLKQFMMNLPKLQTSVPKRGDLLLVMGSPFGILSPIHFFDHISLGSVANTYPSSSFSSSLLMADIRCLPGMEGSPVFDEQAQFVGVLTRPLRQKISGTEIQLVIPWEAIASSCSGLLQDEPLVPRDVINLNNGSQLPSPVEKAMASICLITTDDGSWASGILLNKKGLVLTNAHLLEPWRFGKTPVNSERNVNKSQTPETFHKSNENLPPTNYLTNENKVSRHSSSGICQRGIRVRLDFMDPWLWTNASIVYISKGPLDIALLQIEFASDQLCPLEMDFTCPSPGSKAYVIGHGLFGPRCGKFLLVLIAFCYFMLMSSCYLDVNYDEIVNLLCDCRYIISIKFIYSVPCFMSSLDFLPSVCFGVIAKVIEAKGFWKHGTYEPNIKMHSPAMLETTATVHPGSSGGAVVNSDGHMIGLVTSNAKHGGGTVIPHLNFSIPCAALEPVFKFSKDSQKFWILEELDKPNEHLSSVWALMPSLYAKPAPLLPELPQVPTEDNGKVTKGARFSKFVAERNKLLKNMAQPNTTSSYPDELMRNCKPVPIRYVLTEVAMQMVEGFEVIHFQIYLIAGMNVGLDQCLVCLLGPRSLGLALEFGQEKQWLCLVSIPKPCFCAWEMQKTWLHIIFYKFIQFLK
ncbi:glyoxysomal processing protease, glyoxysomal [Dorcoceras hygrometricum]|uniref:Glyoxysomal processing protease, glyoxysomal n=1 Tax=Dorcoceras hygrometricum TaxID=472368 RepID=A0A2Z7D178_9LAMI|nr:glyoxysomal processing protease, glyoxysomal [Dorcoceras hygrometricum]